MNVVLVSYAQTAQKLMPAETHQAALNIPAITLM